MAHRHTWGLLLACTRFLLVRLAAPQPVWVLLHTEPLVVPVVAWVHSVVSPAIVVVVTGLVVLHQETTQATVVVPAWVQEVHRFTVQPQVQAPAWGQVRLLTLVAQAKARKHDLQVSLLHRWRWVLVVVKDSSNVKPPRSRQ